MKRALVMVMSLAAITLGILLVNEFEYSESTKYTYTPQYAGTEIGEEITAIDSPISFCVQVNYALPAENGTIIFDSDDGRMTIGNSMYTKTLLYFMSYSSGVGEMNLSMKYTDGSVDEICFPMTDFSALHAVYIRTVSKTIKSVNCQLIPKECNTVLYGDDTRIERLSRNTIKSNDFGYLELRNDTGTVVGNLEVEKGNLYVIDATTSGYTLYKLD